MKAGKTFKVTLLGTGCPIISSSRFGNSTLIEVGNEKYLFDVGRGATIRLNQLGIQPGEINKVFLTHLHSDHLVGFPDVWLSGLIPNLGKRSIPMQIWGPQGTKQLAYHLEQAFTADIKARTAHGTIFPEGSQLKVKEFEEGLIYEKEDLKITSFQVDHGTIKPCYGFRIDYGGRSVLISGDTKYNENLINHAKDVDVLIHEIAAAHTHSEDAKTVEHIMDIHTTPEQAGEIFNLVQPKLAVYTHIVLLGGISEEEADLVGRTKKVYSGEVIVGEDLMEIDISDKVSFKNSRVNFSSIS